MNWKRSGRKCSWGEGEAQCYPTGMAEKKGFKSDFVQFVPVFTVEGTWWGLTVLIASIFEAEMVSVDLCIADSLYGLGGAFSSVLVLCV
jgi:hypothetical protein